MIDFLSKLIREYSVNDKIIDQKFISDVVNIGVIKYNIEDYISGILPLENNQFGSYSMDKFIKINIDLLNEMYIFSNTNFKLKPDEIKYYKYINVVQKILHELEHAKQYKQLIDMKKDLETMVLIGSLPIQRLILNKDNKTLEGIPETEKRQYCKEQFEIYKKYYDYAPEERMAEINSREECLNIINELAGEESKLSLMYKYIIYNFTLRGYENNIIPTKLYLEKRGYLEFWDPINKFSNNYSYIERGKTGTFLTEEEKEKIKEKQNILVKKGVNYV